MVDSDNPAERATPSMSRRAFNRLLFGSLAGAGVLATGVGVWKESQEREPQQPEGTFLFKRNTPNGVEFFKQDIKNVNGEEIPVYTEKASGSDFVALSPDGTKLALSSYSKLPDGLRERAVKVLDLRKNEIVTTINNTEIVSNLEWSANGDQVLYTDRAFREGNDTLHIFSLKGNQEKKIDLGYQVLDIATKSDDENTIAIGKYDDPNDELTIQIVKVEGNQIVNQESFKGFRPQWSPDGAKLLYETDPNGDLVYNAEVRDFATNKVLGKKLYAYNPIWSPDSSVIAYAQHISGKEAPGYVKTFLSLIKDEQTRQYWQRKFEVQTTDLLCLWDPDIDDITPIGNEEISNYPTRWLNNDWIMTYVGHTSDSNGYIVNRKGTQSQQLFTIPEYKHIVGFIPASK